MNVYVYEVFIEAENAEDAKAALTDVLDGRHQHRGQVERGKMVREHSNAVLSHWVGW